jgi:diguanylate cyclase (GGDEF)-like protein
MASFSNQQLQLIIAQLDQAIFNHDQWYKHILRILILRIPPEKEDIAPEAHRHCHFGQWYESSQAFFIRENPAFISLGDAHKKMHISAQNLLQKISEGLLILSIDWDSFDKDIDKMRLAFQSLRHEFTVIAKNRDPLTEAQTRDGMLAEISDQNALVQRGQQNCALVMFDLDHFKQVNDTYGHIAGDLVLVSTVQRIKTLLRPYDRIYRYGGEEFIICMPRTTLAQAHMVAERMREAIAEQNIRFDNSRESLRVTASFGVTILTQLRSVEESIDYVDKAMYEAKRAGRNRVVDDVNL